MSNAAKVCGEFKLIDRLFKNAGGSAKAFTGLESAMMHRFTSLRRAWSWW